jgi:acyl CoA:acetate/3-ketoacid CoA transferase alpha subunit
MWIESDDYIGLDRRTGVKRFRLTERRRTQPEERDYSLAALVRQLRAAAMDLRDSKSRRRFKMRLQATMHLARVMGHTQAAIELQRLDTTIAEAELGEPRSAAVIDRFLGNVAAMAAD